ncbi:unnamed protein product [Heligmosomoides polygyrus]|uniref:GTD-binding domain-containing protein n=1 Tax=Heligmosomoides polygyrus TaxID=6339 RepID=A0A3P8EMI3_HELPZ|nr:unnamed protein product [Heligmosomoides polygyrus]
MDLIDLYHAHDQHVSPPSPECEAFVHKLTNTSAGNTRKGSTRMKKPRFVPWEPFKAAPSPDRKGVAPNGLPELIPYGNGVLDENSNKHIGDAHLVDARRDREKHEDIVSRSDREICLEKQLAEMKSELDLERKLNAELKRLMVATISDELQGQVEALTEDKIRLAHRVEEYSERLIQEDEQVDQLLIDRDVWKCKFLAQSIRTDELTFRSDFLLGISEAANVSKDARYFADLDLSTFFVRSPCDERVRRKAPNFENVTVSCCRKCSGREIQLL